MTMTTLSLWQGHNTAYLLAVGCESSGSQVLWNRWSRWRFCHWSIWRHVAGLTGDINPQDSQLPTYMPPLAGFSTQSGCQFHIVFQIHILFSKIIKLIDIRVKSIITFFEIIYHHNNCSANNIIHK